MKILGRTREEKSGCASVRSRQEKEEIVVGDSIAGGREREREKRNRRKPRMRESGKKVNEREKL